MFKFLSKLAAILTITLLLSAGVAMASGKMEAVIGDTVDLSADSTLIAAEFKWVVLKDKKILDTQTGKNFSYKFDEQGEYVINLTAISGSQVETTSINVNVGQLYQRPTVIGEEGTVIGGEEGGGAVIPLRVNLSTLPAMDAENKITLLADGKVEFSLEQSYGDIIEYRIDKNIYQDSDGNGVANDDIDNANDNSYLTGLPWSTDYKQGETPKITAEITLVDKNGNKAKKQAEIVFGKRVTTGEPKAILDALPAPDPKDGLVHLYNDPHKVSFYAMRSEGKILEYRIDKNIFEDSNNDGDPANDIDNINDISFKTGDVFSTEYKKTDSQIIAQLIVVGEGGKGSRVQKGFVFGEKPLPPPSVQIVGGIRLTADKDYVVKGDPVTYTVKGLQQKLESYKFGWDFNGDGTVEQETDGVNTVTYIYDTPGVVKPKVIITDDKGNTSDKTMEVTVKDTQVTKADFSPEVNGNTVKFTDNSTVAYNLSDKTLIYKWDFGDTDAEGYQKQIDQIGAKNPVYTYNKKGKYLVTLTITDADQVTDSKSAEVEIAQDLPTGGTEAVTTEGAQAGAVGSLFVKILKVLLYLVLIVIILILLLIGGFLVFLKVQHPDLTFEELIDEFKVKILTIIGAHEMPPPGEVPPRPPRSVTGERVAPEEQITEEKEEPVTHEEEAPPPQEVGPIPDWLKGTEVIEGETEEEKPVEGPVEGLVEEPIEEEIPPVAEEAPAEEVPVEEAPSEEAPTEETTEPIEGPIEGPVEGQVEGPVEEEVPPSEEKPAQVSTTQTTGAEAISAAQPFKKKKRRRRHKKKPQAGGAPGQSPSGSTPGKPQTNAPKFPKPPAPVA